LENNFLRYPSPGASHHPLPSGEGFASKHFSNKRDYSPTLKLIETMVITSTFIPLIVVGL
jgi:hypothetical protein